MTGNAYAGVLPATQFGHMSSPTMPSSANYRRSGSFAASLNTLSNCSVRTARLVWRSVMHSSCMLRVSPHACCWHAVLLVAYRLSLYLLSAARCASCCRMVCSASSRCSQYASCPPCWRLGVLPSAGQTRRLTYCLLPCSLCHCLLALRRFACRFACTASAYRPPERAACDACLGVRAFWHNAGSEQQACTAFFIVSC